MKFIVFLLTVFSINPFVIYSSFAEKENVLMSFPCRRGLRRSVCQRKFKPNSVVENLKREVIKIRHWWAVGQKSSGSFYCKKKDKQTKKAKVKQKNIYSFSSGPTYSDTFDPIWSVTNRHNH